MAREEPAEQAPRQPRRVREDDISSPPRPRRARGVTRVDGEQRRQHREVRERRAPPRNAGNGPAGVDPMTSTGLAVPGRGRPVNHRQESTNLADILERVLDKGIVIAGDIRINLLDIELLTIKIRLLVASVDKAREIGIDWWEHDPTLSSRRNDVVEENRMLRRRLVALKAAAVSTADEPGVHQPTRRPAPGRRGAARDG